MAISPESPDATILERAIESGLDSYLPKGTGVFETILANSFVTYNEARLERFYEEKVLPLSNRIDALTLRVAAIELRLNAFDLQFGALGNALLASQQAISTLQKTPPVTQIINNITETTPPVSSSIPPTASVPLQQTASTSIDIIPIIPPLDQPIPKPKIDIIPNISPDSGSVGISPLDTNPRNPTPLDNPVNPITTFQ